MTDTSQSRAKELFLDALELDPDERTAYLRAACGDDAALLARAEALLVAHDRSSGIEDLVTAEADAEPEEPLALVGDYELLEELGRGAAGTVYLARQTSLGREVALKVLRAGSLASENDVRRFRREAEAAAALDHPGIVPVFEIGKVDDHHYFTMKRVDGESLDRAVDRFKGDPRGAAELVATVARAVHHAHQRGVLHRDIKPSNILLDSDGDPHVADFGIARPLGSARITRTGQVCGTPAYMSPEQSRGDEDVTVATDVWSLGCVLYELLTGELPFPGPAVADVMRGVQEVEPRRPVGVDRDLVTIVETCLAKQPARRYGSAAELARDLDRWLEHLPIAARPATRLERLRLMCRRSPVAASLAFAVALLLLVLGLGAGAASIEMGQSLRETRSALRGALIANARAEQQSDLAGRREVALDFLAQAAEIESGPDIRDLAITTLTLSDLVVGESWPLDFETQAPIGVDDTLERVVLSMVDRTVEVRRAVDGAVLATVPATGQRGRTALLAQDGRRLWLRRDAGAPQIDPLLEVWDLGPDPPERIHHRTDASNHFALDPKTGLVALIRREDGVIELIDEETFDVVHELSVPGEIPVRAAWRPDGGALALTLGSDDRVVVISVPDGAPIVDLRLEAKVVSADWSPDGELLIAGCYDQRAYVWETADWELRAELRGHEGEVVRVFLLPGGLAVTAAWDGTARLWDVETESEILRMEPGVIGFDRNGRRTLFHDESTVTHAKLVVEDVLRELPAHEGKAPREVAESADGAYLATCGSDDWILWDTETWERVATPTTGGVVHAISFDGSAVLTSGDDGLLRWRITDGRVGEPEVLVEGECMRSAVSPDGRWIGLVRPPEALLIGRDGEIREVGRHGRLDRVVFSPGGEWMAIGSWVGSGLRVWDTETGELVCHLEAEASSAMGAFSPDGEWLVIATFEHVRFYRTGTWEPVHELARPDPARPSVPAAFSPDGSMVALGISPTSVRLVQVDGWHTLAELEPAEPRNLFHLLFIDGGRSLAIATPSQRLLIWDLEALATELAQRGLDQADGSPLRATAWTQPGSDGER